MVFYRILFWLKFVFGKKNQEFCEIINFGNYGNSNGKRVSSHIFKILPS